MDSKCLQTLDEQPTLIGLFARGAKNLVRRARSIAGGALATGTDLWRHGRQPPCGQRRTYHNPMPTARLLRAGYALLIALTLGCQPTVVPPDNTADLFATSTSHATANVAGEGKTDMWSRAIAPREFQFPADHGSHEDFRIEWWYYTGNLQATMAVGLVTN